MLCNECRVKEKGSVAGQGFTRYTCEKCGQTGFHHNTNTPKYCTFCSNTYFICEKCGKNILIEKILRLKEEANLYAVALEIDCSEYSLRKFIKQGYVGNRVMKKIIKWYKETEMINE